MRRGCIAAAAFSAFGAILSAISFWFDPQPLDVMFGGIFTLFAAYFAIGAWRFK